MTDEPKKDESWRGRVGKLTDEELAEFLATDVLCRVAALDNEGWPFVAPVWFQFKDGGVLPGRPRALGVGPLHSEGQARLPCNR